MKLVLVSSNEEKIKETQEILGFPLEIEKIDLDEIQSLNLEEIVKKKAEEAFEKIQKPLIVDDVGLFVEAWSGFPGPFIKFLIQSGGNELLLRMLKNETNRAVTAQAAIAYHNGIKIYTFIGEVKGVIPETPRGDKGWGWDPIFQPNGTSRTYAEMNSDEKNSNSHRRRALEKLKEFLDK